MGPFSEPGNQPRGPVNINPTLIHMQTMNKWPVTTILPPAVNVTMDATNGQIGRIINMSG